MNRLFAILFFLVAMSASAQSYRFDSRTIGPFSAGSNNYWRWDQVLIRTDTGALAGELTLGSFNQATMAAKEVDQIDRPYPFIVIYRLSSALGYPVSYLQWYKAYEVGGDEAQVNVWADITSPPMQSEGDPLPTLPDPTGALEGANLGSSFAGSESPPPPPPPDGGGGGSTGGSNLPGPVPDGSGTGGTGSNPSPGNDRVKLLTVLLDNTTGGEQRYAVTVKTGIGQVLYQRIVSVPAYSTTSYEYQATDQTSVIVANLVYQANPNGTTGTLPPSNPTIEGTGNLWDVPTGTNAGNGGGNSSNLPGVTPSTRGSDSEANNNARHSEALEASRRIQSEVKDASSKISASVGSAADKSDLSVEAASALIKNSIEFASGQMVAATTAVKDAVVAQNVPNEGTPDPAPGSPTISGPGSLPSVPSSSDIAQASIDSINGGASESVTGAAEGIKTTVGSVSASLRDLRDALGLGATLGQEQLQFSYPDVLGGGNIIINLEEMAGPYFDLFRNVVAFFLSLWFVQEFISAVRSAFA
jgi:hypothetical protein